MIRTIVYHKVADHAKWKAGFDAFQPQRLAGGELSAETGSFEDDPSVAYVLNEWASVEAATGFFANPQLAETMQQLGVLEKPHFLLLDKKEGTLNNSPYLVQTLLHHKVADYAKWKAGFDASTAMIKAAGGQNMKSVRCTTTQRWYMSSLNGHLFRKPKPF